MQFFSRHCLYLTAFLLLPVIYFLSMPIFVGDLAIWIAHGKYLIEHGEILRRDIFSVLPTLDLIYSVGSSFVYGFIYRFFDLDGVVIFHKLIVLAISILWYFSSFAKMKSPWSLRNALVVVFAWIGCSMLAVDRPALFAMLPFVLSYLILQKEKELTTQDIVLLNVINVAWLNIHGSWLILGVMYIWRELARTVLFKRKISLKSTLGIVSVLTMSLLNPFGYKVIPYVFETARVSKLRHIQEWESLSSTTNTLQFYIFSALVILFFGMLVSSLRNKKQQALEMMTSPFFLLLLLGGLGVRNTLWSFFVLIPFAYQQGWMKEHVPVEQKNYFFKHVINAVLVATLLLFTIMLLPQNKPKVAWMLPESKRMVYGTSAPMEFAEYLSQTSDRDPVFNDWEYGSYLLLTQSHRIFIDARNVIYDQAEYETYFKVVDARPDWQDILDQYKIKYVMLDKKLRSELIRAMHQSKKWELAKESEDIILFVRFEVGLEHL